MDWELSQDLIFSLREIWLCNPPYISPIIDGDTQTVFEDFWIGLVGLRHLFCNSCGLFQSLQVKITGKEKDKDLWFY